MDNLLLLIVLLSIDCLLWTLFYGELLNDQFLDQMHERDLCFIKETMSVVSSTSAFAIEKTYKAMHPSPYSRGLGYI